MIKEHVKFYNVRAMPIDSGIETAGVSLPASDGVEEKLPRASQYILHCWRGLLSLLMTVMIPKTKWKIVLVMITMAKKILTN